MGLPAHAAPTHRGRHRDSSGRGAADLPQPAGHTVMGQKCRGKYRINQDTWRNIKSLSQQGNHKKIGFKILHKASIITLAEKDTCAKQTQHRPALCCTSWAVFLRFFQVSLHWIGLTSKKGYTVACWAVSTALTLHPREILQPTLRPLLLQLQPRQVLKHLAQQQLSSGGPVSVAVLA